MSTSSRHQDDLRVGAPDSSSSAAWPQQMCCHSRDGLLAQAVRAMRFDAGANRKKLDTAESARERVIAEEELAKALEEDDGL